MSGILTGIAKVFTPVVKGLGTAIGKGVSAIGAATATAGSAAGGGIISGAAKGSTSGLFGGKGILSKIFSGAGNVVGTTSATASATSGGMVNGGLLSKIGGFLKTEGGAGLVAGLGTGLMKMSEMRAQREEARMDREHDAAEREKERGFEREKQQRVTDSYSVPTTALPNGQSSGVVQDVARPLPAQRYDRAFTWIYDPELGRTVKVPA